MYFMNLKANVILSILFHIQHNNSVRCDIRTFVTQIDSKVNNNINGKLERTAFKTYKHKISILGVIKNKFVMTILILFLQNQYYFDLIRSTIIVLS